MVAIDIRNLTKRFRDTVAVDKMNLQIGQGELFSLLGVNGAGKTTTLKMISGITRPTEGDVLLFTKSICREPAAAKAWIALSPQETAVAPGLTVEENLGLMCGIYGFTKGQKKEKIAELTKLLSLTEVIGKKAGKLSGGYKRRLSIAMALICQPKILFLDEPTLGLDVLTRRELWDLIRSLKGKITIILTTHYMEEAEALSDRVAIMKEGRILSCDTPQGLKDLAGTQDFEQAFVQIVKEAGK